MPFRMYELSAASIVTHNQEINIEADDLIIGAGSWLKLGSATLALSPISALAFGLTQAALHSLHAINSSGSKLNWRSG